MHRLPDFFILGAPKCGTSALDYYLAEHPGIFMCRKELSYFATDFPQHRDITEWEDYLALFERARPDQCVGEGTFCYLYSREALPQIHRLRPDAKLIAMLRNPVDLAYSMHSQLTYNGEENLPFEAAIHREPERRAGKLIPAACKTPAMLEYTRLARLGEQVERIYELYPAEQIKLILFDDFQRRTAEVYADVLEFLGVPHDGRREFPVLNQNKRHQSRWLGQFTERPPEWLLRGARTIKRALGRQSLGLMDLLRRLNVREQQREPLSVELRAELNELFRDDVEKLSTYVGRDLTDWCGRSANQLCEVA